MTRARIIAATSRREAATRIEEKEEAMSITNGPVPPTHSADEIVLAHSPDSDDAFMFYGLRQDAVDTEGIRYRHELADIETLNRRALAGELAITAVSIHAYAYLADRYVLLPHGASFGDGYGPCVVCRPGPAAPRSLADLAGKRLAIPGTLTSAALAARLYSPLAEPVVVPFDRIGDAVLAGEVDAGVLIHEGQLTWKDDGFLLLADLGVVWKEETGLPLPLGGNAVRKDLGAETIGKISRALGASIDYALANREAAVDDAMRYSRGLTKEKTDRFVGMYVNDWTRSYGERGREAVRLFLRRAHEAGALPALVEPEWVAERP
jgi:1,4-dihydroxy-6-naphthoate synthase